MFFVPQLVSRECDVNLLSLDKVSGIWNYPVLTGTNELSCESNDLLMLLAKNVVVFPSQVQFLGANDSTMFSNVCISMTAPKCYLGRHADG